MSKFSFLSFLFPIFFSSPSTSALSFQDSVDVQFTFNPSLTITVSGDLVIDNLAPGSSDDSNIIDVNVSTNNITGYVLTATTGNTTHTTTELTQSGVTNKFTSLATNADLSSLTTDNTWGYSFSSDNGTNWTNYSGLPLYTAASGKELVNTNTNASIPIKFKIGAKASNTQPSGTYTNVINFIAVANPEPQLGPVACTPGYICYQPNALTGVQGTMADQSATDNNTVTLYASNSSRSGYGFAGWSDVYDYDTNANAHFYGPNEDITVPTGTTANGTSLYAVWIKSAGSMQGARATQICHSLTAAPADGPAGLASVSALTDQRDNQTYAIARLADGSCWMIENLRLDAEHTRSAQDIALSAGYNTDATFGNFLGLANSEDTNFANSVAANSIYYSGTQSGTASVNIGTNNLPGFRMPRYSRYNVVNRASVPTSNNGVMYSYGNYYSWPATIASTSYYDTENVVIDTSICPYNWRIPSGGRVTNNVNVTGYLDTYTDFYYLGYSIMGFTAYEDTPNNGYSHYDVRTNANGDLGSAAFRKYPNNYVYSGGMMDSGNEINGRGEMGYYWTSTTRTANNANGTYVTSESVNPGTSNLEKFSGAAVRCLLNLSYGGA